MNRLFFVFLLLSLTSLSLAQQNSKSPIGLIELYRELYFDRNIANSELLDFFLPAIRERYDAEIADGERFLGNSSLEFVLDAPVLIRDVESIKVVDCDEIETEGISESQECVEILGKNKKDVFFSVSFAFVNEMGQWKISHVFRKNTRNSRGTIIPNDK